MVQISMKSEEGTEKANYDEPCGSVLAAKP